MDSLDKKASVARGAIAVTKADVARGDNLRFKVMRSDAASGLSRGDARSQASSRKRTRETAAAPTGAGELTGPELNDWKLLKRY